MKDGYLVFVRSKSARRGDTWLAVGDDLEGRYEMAEKNGKAVIRHAAKMPERQATVHDRHTAKSVAAGLEAAGGQAVIVPVRANGQKMVGQEVENLSAAADSLWEAKQA